MPSAYFEDQLFESIDFSLEPLGLGEYEGCNFVNCNFSNTDLSEMQFIDCQFKSCNLSMVKTIKTTLNGTIFQECKILGVSFENCQESLFQVKFEKCILNFSSFFKRNLKKIAFRYCTMQETDFTNADLTSAIFDHCDLTNAKFEQTILEKADLRSAFNYSINPEINRIKKAKFSLQGIAGLLDKYDIVIE
jgi:fluoroquinolone resistance protein